MTAVEASRGVSSWAAGTRPITLAILAMGGEGGGVLADWIVALAEAAGDVAQNTSVAGVAQRTGATIYYVEIYPASHGAGERLEDVAAGRARGRHEPVLSLMPTPGEVDVVIASELMEAGRSVQRGFVTPDRTTLIASTNRVYSITEKSALADGRVDSAVLLRDVQGASRRLVAADFAALAERARSVISASLFGALAGSGELPYPREAFEEAIRAGGKGVEASLRAFAGGYDVAQAALAAPEGNPAIDATAAGGSRRTASDEVTGRLPGDLDSEPVPGEGGSRRTAVALGASIGLRPRTPQEEKDAEEARRREVAAREPEALVGRYLAVQARRVGRSFPAAARSMLLHGVVRTAVYQDLGYADRYLDRVARLVPYERDGDGAARLTLEAARHVALWMSYQDTIQVAFQKTRAARLAGIRDEARAGQDDLVEVREFLHPQIDEITETMPTAMGQALADSAAFRRLVHLVTHRGFVVSTTSMSGFLTLSSLARLRPLRPKSLRFGREQEAIDTWLDVAADVARDDYDLACEIVECARVLKGYGATHAHGRDSFAALMAAARRLRGGHDATDATGPDAAGTLARLRAAALADEDGAALREALGDLGMGDVAPSGPSGQGADAHMIRV